MQETTVKLTDKIVKYLKEEASDLGMEVPELIRFIIGSYAQAERLSRRSMPSMGILMKSASLGFSDEMLERMKERLKEQAEAGELSCRRCTMKITAEDIENGKCGTCGTSIKEALTGENTE